MKQTSRASRAILKAGFEMLAYDNDKAYVMEERFDGLRKGILRGGYQGWLIHSTTHRPPTSEITMHYPPVEIPGTSRFGLMSSLVVFGLRLATAWPGRQDVLRQQLPDSPELRDLRILHFDRFPSNARDLMTMNVIVTYGSRRGWDDGMPFADQIRKIDGD